MLWICSTINYYLHPFFFSSKNHTWLEQTARLCHNLSSKMWSQQPFFVSSLNDAWGNENGCAGDYHDPDVTQCVAGNHLHWLSILFEFFTFMTSTVQSLKSSEKVDYNRKTLLLFQRNLDHSTIYLFFTCQHTLVHNTVATNKNSITMNHGSIWWNN